MINIKNNLHYLFMNENQIYIGAYQTQRDNLIIFRFYFGQNLPQDLYGEKLVQSIRVPTRVKHLFNSNIQESVLPIGYIKYAINNKTVARSQYYYPLNNFLHERGYGLGSLLELLAVNNLKKMGIKHLMSTAEASKSRREQLKKMGFKIEAAYGIKEWQKGVGKAIRTASKFKSKHL